MTWIADYYLYATGNIGCFVNGRLLVSGGNEIMLKMKVNYFNQTTSRCV